MLVLTFHTDEIVKITVGKETVRLRMVDWHRRRVAIEVPDNVPVDRFRIQVGTEIPTLKQLERETGVHVGGKGWQNKNGEQDQSRKEPES